MNFVLVAFTLSALTGEPQGMEQIHSYPTPQECLDVMNEGHIERPEDGKIKTLQCVREDSLGEATT